MALIDKASLLMVPSVYEDGTLYNVLPSGNKAPDETGNHNGYDQTRADFTFSRGSNLAATRVNANGLIEKGRENIFTYSQDFRDAAGWLVSNATKVSVNETDPNGNSTAANITWTAGSGRYFYKNITQGNLLTASFYIKSNGGGNKFRLFGDGANDLSQDFTATDEWQRFEFFFERGTGQGTGITNASDNSAADLLIAFGQLENGLVATPYIETGATTATAGVLENTPRIDYSSGAGALLLESQRTNLITHSEYFDNWTKVDTTLTHNYGISPEGVRNSTRVQFADDTAYMYIAPGGTSSGTYASTIYIKGTAGETIKFGKGGNVASGAMHTLNGDWQRIEHITTDVGLSVHLSTYGGSTARDMEIYGCQLEAGSHVSSYVPTYGSAATRGADSCSVTGASDVIGQTEGTLFVECEYERTSTAVTARKLISVNSGNSTNLVDIFCPSLGNNLTARVRANGGQFGAISISNTPTGMIKIAYAYKANDYALYINGTQYGTDTTGGTFTFSSSVSTHQIGDGEAGGDELGGVVKQSMLFKERLSNTELAALTA